MTGLNKAPEAQSIFWCRSWGGDRMNCLPPSSSYEYTDYNDLGFDAYMIPTQDLLPGEFRLLETDYRVVLPTNSPIRVLTSAEDVLHS
ncbi:hypothetical protein CRUP_034474 [Coryphaenoides rupestris]|nr:hypothetical protein CRUP_034474 [Coryphaenoides rupestris]